MVKLLEKISLPSYRRKETSKSILKISLPSYSSKKVGSSFPIQKVPLPSYATDFISKDLIDFSLGFNSRDNPIGMDPRFLSDGQNIVIDPQGTLSKRKGMDLYGNVLGTTTDVLGLFDFVNLAGTEEILAVYDTGVYRYVAGVWTALTSVTMTTDKVADGAFFPSTNKFYIINQTDAVVKYTSGTAGVQTDTDFKKGKYIIHYQRRLLVANESANPERLWYTDSGVDTFSAANYIGFPAAITGMIEFYDKVLVFTKRKVYLLQNFSFDGVAAGPEVAVALPVEFGAIYDRTVQIVNGAVYFLGQDAENKAHIYRTMGWQTEIISDIISPTLQGLAAGQLANACAGSDGRFYHLAVAESGETDNNFEIVYDTVRKIFLPPNDIPDFTCYVSIESSGQIYILAGTSTPARVYRLKQNYYDELIDQSLTATGDTDKQLAGATTTRVAQSFKASWQSTENLYVTGVMLPLKKVSGTTTDMTVRIETDSSGPTGTLANANATATITALTSTSYAWITTKFSTAFTLAGNTTYWIVLKHTTEGSGTSIHAWYADASSPTYANGSTATYASSAWTVDTATDQLFGLLTQSKIDAYGTTASFFLAPLGQKAHLRKIFAMADADGAWNLQIGINKDEWSSFDNYDLSLSPGNASLWGTGVWGTMVWGGAQETVQTWLNVYNTRGRVFKLKFRNNGAGQNFTLRGVRLVADVIPLLT